MGETEEDERKSRAEEVTAAYWDGYAAGLRDQAGRKDPVGWVWTAAAGLSVLSWGGAAALVVIFF